VSLRGVEALDGRQIQRIDDLYDLLADKDKERPDFPQRMSDKNLTGTFRSRKKKGVDGAQKLER
jgi:hypothetical protein